MKNLIKELIKSILLLTMILTFNVANAQARYSPKSETDISISILNLTQPTDRTIEFDVYLLDTDPLQSFQLTTVQLGLLINSGIYTGGILSGSYVNTNSGLLTIQQPSAVVSIASTLSGYPNQTLIRLASRTPPGAGNGSMISSTAPGTLMTHIKITSTVPWILNSKANITFTPSTAITPLYATAVAEYIAGTGTPLVITPGVNAIVCCNPDLNKTTQINSNTIVQDLTVANGETLNIIAPNQLTVTGTLSNNGTINLLSDVAGTATIKTPATVSGSGTYTMKQYLPSYRTWYMTSPMTGTTNKPLDNNSAYPALLKWFDESKTDASAWTDVTVTGMTGGKGYLLNPGTTSGASTLTFNGTINSGNQASALTSRTGVADKAGFNLIGNPFPAYLDWKLVCDNVSNAAKMRSKTMWYRTKVGSFTFQTVNGQSGLGTPETASRYIPPMQGFWVRAVESVSGTLAFNTDMLADAPVSDNLLKAPAPKNTENQKLRIQISNGNDLDEILLYFNANASNAYDAYDSPKMLNGSTSTVPDIYTLVDAEKLAINGMKDIPYNIEIPLYFKANASKATSFTFSVNELSNFETGTSVFIKKNVTGAKQLISDGTSYIFDPSALGDEPAFSLIFKTPVSISDIKDTSLEKISIFVNNNRQISITIVEGVEKGAISVYNTLGQMLFSNDIKQSTTLIEKSFIPGVYFVKVNQLTLKALVK